MTSTSLKSICLLADSNLLFRGDGGAPVLGRLTAHLKDAPEAKAAYIGASNGDAPEYFALFEAAMEIVGIRNCRMIHSSPSPAERAFLENADLILLAGGDVEKGWTAFQQAGFAELLQQRYAAGTVLVGISAGAVHLGLCGWSAELPAENVFDTLKLVPFVIDAHDEHNHWEVLRRVVSLKGPLTRGIGIPSGGGMMYHADGTVEPIRRPLHEFLKTNHQVSNALLIPKA